MESTSTDRHLVLLKRTKAHIRELQRTRDSMRAEVPRLRRKYESKIDELEEKLKVTEAFAVEMGTKLSNITSENKVSTRRVEALEKMLGAERDNFAKQLAEREHAVQRVTDERNKFERSYQLLHDSRTEGHEHRPYLSSAPQLFGWTLIQPQRGVFGSSFIMQAICTALVLVFMCWALASVQSATHVKLLVTWSIFSRGIGSALWPLGFANLVHFYVPGVAVMIIVLAGAEYLHRERLKAMPAIAQCMSCSIFLYAVLSQWILVAARLPFDPLLNTHDSGGLDEAQVGSDMSSASGGSGGSGGHEGVRTRMLVDTEATHVPPLWSSPLASVAVLYPAPMLLLIRVLQSSPAWPEIVNTTHRALYSLQWILHSMLATYTCAVTLKMLSALSHADFANAHLQRSTVGASVAILQRLFSSNWPSMAETMETILLGWTPLAVASFVGLQVMYQFVNRVAVWLHLWSLRDVSWTFKPIVPAKILVVIHLAIVAWYYNVTVSLHGLLPVSVPPVGILDALFSPLLFTTAIGLARIVKAVATPIDTDGDAW